MQILQDQYLEDQQFNEEEMIDGKQQPPQTKHQQLIKIRCRRSNKSQKTIQIPPHITRSSLSQKLQAQFRIAKQKQLIYHKAKKISSEQQSQQQIPQLSQNDIIFLYDLDSINKDNISIYLQFFNCQLVQYIDNKIATGSNQIIISTFKNILLYQVGDLQQFLYIQCNRYINIMQTFQKQQIEDQSLIIAVPKNTNKIFTLSQISIKQEQFMEQQLRQPKKINYSNNNQMFQFQMLDFKKKMKFRVYHTVILPQSKQLIWKQDSCCSQISKKSLRKKMKKKKVSLKKNHKIQNSGQNKLKSNKQNKHQNMSNSQLSSNQNNLDQNISEKEIFQEMNRNDGRREKYRLFQSACIKKKMEIKQLKPPKIENNLFDEIQEINFEENFMEGGDNKNILKTSAPLTSLQNSLKASVGKNKGMFIPVLSFNINSNFQDDDEEVMEI